MLCRRFSVSCRRSWLRSAAVWGGGGGSAPINPIQLQDAVELPWDFAPDGSKKFTLFAARPDPDVQGLALYASVENPPVDYDNVDSDAHSTLAGRSLA